MNVLNPIKLFLGQYFLKRELKHFDRNLKLYNYHQAQSFGIVYEYKNEGEFKILEQLIHRLNDDKKKVKVIVFIKNENMLEYIPQRLTVDYIKSGDLNWFLIPHSKYVSDFMNAGFHVLINLNFQQCFPLNYIVSLSKANYKVGVFNDVTKSHMDFLIKMDPNLGLEKVLKEILKYLKIINPR